MTDELQRQIAEQLTDDDTFIAWLEPGASEERIELLDYFQRRLINEVFVASFTLLDMEQMWQRLLQLNGGEFSRVWRKKVEVIDWVIPQADGKSCTRSCCFRAEGLLAIYEEVLAAR